MPLEPYARGKTWWARGKVEYDGLPITGYIRESTGASTEAGAQEWIRNRTTLEQRRYHLGEEADEREYTFASAVLEYGANAEMAKHLMPIVEKLGAIPVRKITAKMIRDLAPELYPKNSTDSWRRWVITPARAVINNAHDLGRCPPIRIAGFTDAERIKQDRVRGKRGRQKKQPGSWEWLLAFRAAAHPIDAALALLMFTTGARIGQSVAMTDENRAKLDQGVIIIPGAKGHDDREVEIMPELVAELKALKPIAPRGWDDKPANRRLFGYAGRCGPLRAWRTACKRAGIAYLSPHAAGRHGFGQEMRVRQGVDKNAVEAAGGWSPEGNMVDRIYTHPEDHGSKVLGALRTGRVQAEKKTGIKLRKAVRK